jgi:hypothetical protein
MQYVDFKFGLFEKCLLLKEIVEGFRLTVINKSQQKFSDLFYGKLILTANIYYMRQ